MKTIEWAVPLGVLTTAAVIYAFMKVGEERKQNVFKDRHLIERGSHMPIIWLYYDNSEVNSRWWSDFGARSKRAINMPFLNLCYDTIVKHNGDKYRVEVIAGLSDLAVRLGGWEKMPTPLRNPLASVREAEMNWIRATVLAKWGGLWLQPAAIAMKPFNVLPDNKVIFFGTNPTDSFAGPAGTPVPSLRCVWAPEAGLDLFKAWEARAFDRLENSNGGIQARSDEKTDFIELAQKAPNVILMPEAELARKGPSGKPIQCEDLLAAGLQGELPFALPESTVYVPFPWPELKERRMFGWFLRMSEEQVLKDDLVASELFRRSLSR